MAGSGCSTDAAELASSVRAVRTMRFLHIKLVNWRNFQEVEVPLQERAFLVGPNAAGKSNFLDAFRFLSDLASGLLLQGSVGKRGGISTLRCYAARRNPDIQIEIQLGDEIGSPDWEYRLHLSQDNVRRPLVKKEEVRSRGTVILTRPDPDDQRDAQRLYQTHLEQVNANQSFREIQRFLTTVRYLHIVPHLVREPERSVGRINDPFGGDFLEQIARKSKRVRESRLRRIHRALSAAVPQFAELKLDRDPDVGTPHLIARYKHWRAQGAFQDEKQFSDGTLRLIGLLWALLEGDGPLLLEEPELSLHPGVVRYIPSMFAKLQSRNPRQIIVSTQSSELLQDPGIGLDEVLLLRPGEEGTVVSLASQNDTVSSVTGGDGNLADAVMALSSPPDAREILSLLNGQSSD